MRKFNFRAEVNLQRVFPRRVLEEKVPLARIRIMFSFSSCSKLKNAQNSKHARNSKNVKILESDPTENDENFIKPKIVACSRGKC